MHETVQTTCCALGLLQDDREWDNTMVRAGETAMPRQMREVFMYVVCLNNPAEPKRLFNDHAGAMAEDFKAVGHHRPAATDAENTVTAGAMLLLALERLLHLHKPESSLLESVGLPSLSDELRALAEGAFVAAAAALLPREVREETYDAVQEAADAVKAVGDMVQSQLDVVTLVLNAIRDGQQIIRFWDAPAGTGKTFCGNAILAAVRGTGRFAIAVASSGIAATLLKGGRTFHSRFKPNLSMKKEDRDQPFKISKQSALAKLLINAVLILWDEAPMMSRYYLEGLNATVKFLMGNTLPFGGKIVSLTGDSPNPPSFAARGARPNNRSVIEEVANMTTL